MTKSTDAPNDQKPAKENEKRTDMESRLDHGIKETFPGSDPVSVRVSKYAPGDPRGDEPANDSGLLDQARDAASMVRERAGEAASTVRERAGEAASVVRERAGEALSDLSESGRRMAPRLRQGRRVVESTVREHPVSTAIVAGLIGFGVALVAYEAFSRPRTRKTRRRAYGADEIS